ncbi:MAG: PAS domain S-box protein [Sphingobacteriales bacterium JAD_PAG50586_3]|nr:MAG: PAS domain S-box protein [Sphingobacteriales bacterium JAD_PAG50586_3]
MENAESLNADIKILEEKDLSDYVINCMPGVFFLQTEEGKYIRWNDNFERVSGYTKQEILGLNAFDFFDGDNKQLIADRIADAFTQGKSQVEATIVRKTGERVPYYFMGCGVIYNGQRCIIGAGVDITEKIKMEEIVHKSEKKYHSLFEQATDAIFICDFDGYFVDVNQSMCTIIGYTKEELLGMHASKIVEPENLQTNPIPYDRLHQGEHMLNKRKVICKDGTLLHFEVNIKRLDDNMIMAIARDITERKKMEEEKERATYLLNERVKELSTLYGISRMLQALHTNIDDTLLALASAMLNGWQFGNTAAARIVYNNVEYKTPNFGPGVANQSANFTTFGGVQGRVEVVYFDDKPAAFEGPFLKEERDLLNMLTEMLKVYIERKLVDKQREEVASDLMQRNKDLEQFAYIISHNLRAPVANIMGFTDVLNDDDIDSETQKTYINELNISVSKLDEVIRDLNTILQVRREVSEVKEQVSFGKTINNVQVSIKNMIAKEGVQIETDFVEVDEIITLKSYIHSIFYNLISNSIKYRRADVAPVISVTSRKSGNRVILEFEDNGLGIDLNTKGNQVFGLYKRFHTHAEGKGIGLYMTKTQIETLGGKISVDSKVGEGTRFTIELPV